MTRTAVALAAAAFCMTLALACNGSDSLNDEEYFQKVLDAKQEADSRAADVVIPALDPNASREEIERTWEDALNTQVSLAEDRQDALDDLAPRGDLSRLHDLYVAAAAESTEAVKEYRGQQLSLLKAGKYRDVPAAAGRLDDATQALIDLCVDLQDAAGEREIDVDLACS